MVIPRPASPHFSYSFAGGAPAVHAVTRQLHVSLEPHILPARIDDEDAQLARNVAEDA